MLDIVKRAAGLRDFSCVVFLIKQVALLVNRRVTWLSNT